MSTAPGPSASPEVERLVAGYWEHERLSVDQPVLAESHDGWSDVDDYLDKHGPSGLRLVVALIESAPDEEALAYVAAGPLEDLVHAHGDALVDQLDELARTQPRFRAAMDGVWLESGHLQPATEQRLARWITPSPS